MKNSFRLTAAILAVIAVCLCLFLTACKDAVTPNDTKASDTTGTPDTPRASDTSDTTGEPDTSAASDSSTETETDAASGSATSEKPEPTEPVVKKAVIAGGGASTKLVDLTNGRIKRIFNYKYPYEYISGFDEILKRKQEIYKFYQ